MKKICALLIIALSLCIFTKASEARWYDPKMGRFLSEDPSGFSGGDVNFYSYTRNNPVNYTDPLGLWTAQGHTDLTTAALNNFRNTFSQADINLIVAANLRVDRLSNQLNDPAHYMPGTVEEADRLINNLLNNAIEAECGGNHQDAMNLLGQAMHTLQDRYAHFEQNAGWIKHITSSPDDPLKHPALFNLAKYRSIWLINSFLKGIK